MFVPPYGTACRCCKAKRGNLCRSRITKRPLKRQGKNECHEVRWNDHLIGRIS